MLTPSCHRRAAFARNLVVIAPLPLASAQVLVHHRGVDLHTLTQPARVLGGADVPSAASRATEGRGSASPSVPINAPPLRAASASERSAPSCLCPSVPSCLPSDLLSAFLNPSLSLLDIAAAHNLTLDQLTTLMARPDIAEQLSALHSAAALRVRIVAANHLPLAIEALAAIIAIDTSAETFPTLDRDNFRHMVFRQRRTETVRRAASTILRLANFYPPVGRTCRPPSAIEVGPPTSMPRERPSAGGADVPSAAARATEGRGSASPPVPMYAPPLRAASVTHKPATVPPPAAQRRTTVAGGERGSPSKPPEASSVGTLALGAQRPEGDSRLTPRRSLASRLLAACGSSRASGDP
ncbi:MAG: hypothetical protein ACKVS8_04895 [Phycisphaerales bacterium]